VEQITWSEWTEVDRLLNSQPFSICVLKVLLTSVHHKVSETFPQKFVENFPLLDSRQMLQIEILAWRAEHAVKSLELLEQ
jgi:hypothetical protein